MFIRKKKEKLKPQLDRLHDDIFFAFQQFLFHRFSFRPTIGAKNDSQVLEPQHEQLSSEIYEKKHNKTTTSLYN